MNYLIAFTGGILTFISPCVLPMIPMYIAYASGLTVKDFKPGSSPEQKKTVLIVFINSIIFVSGFAIVFSLLAVLFYIFFQTLGNYKIWFNRAAGLIIIIFGLHTAGIINLRFLNYEARIKIKNNKTPFISSFLMGASFGAGWTPCIGPVLSGILFTSGAEKTIFSSISLLLVYSMGLGIPFILSGIVTSKLLTIFNFIKKHYKAVEYISGIFLILIGIILFFDWTGFLSGFFTRVVPQFDIESRLLK